MSILFATDAAEECLKSVPFVAGLCAADGNELVLFHVPDSGPSATGDTARNLSQIESQLASSGVQVRLEEEPAASVGNAVRDRVSKGDIDLVVVRHHHHEKSLLRRLMPGTVPDLVEDLDCDLLVMSGKRSFGGHVKRSLVPINFGDESIASLQRACRWTEPGGEIVLLFNVPSTFPAYHGARGLESDYKTVEQMEERWQADMQRFWSEYGSTGHTSAVVRSEGRWHEEAASAADEHDCDLIVAAESDTFIGTGLAEKLATQDGPCSVLVVRHDGGSVASPQRVE